MQRATLLVATLAVVFLGLATLPAQAEPGTTSTTQCPPQAGSKALVNADGQCTYCPDSKNPGTTVKLDDKYHKYCEYIEHGPPPTNPKAVPQGPLAYTGPTNTPKPPPVNDPQAGITTANPTTAPSAFRQALKTVRQIQPAAARKHKSNLLAVGVLGAALILLGLWLRHRGRQLHQK